MLVWIGCALLVPALLLHWIWLAVLGGGLMGIGLMFSWKPVEDDVIWRYLVRKGVIDDKGNKP